MQAYLLKLLLGAAGPLLQLIITVLVDKKLFDQALSLAQTQVAMLDGADLDEREKRDKALANMKDALKASGIFLRDSLLALALEMAVAGARAASRK